MQWLRRTESRTADTMKPQLSQSPSAIFVYSVPLKFSDLSFVDITGSKGKSLSTREGLGMGGEACRGRVWACLALLWIPHLLGQGRLFHYEIMWSMSSPAVSIISEMQTCKG